MHTEIHPRPITVPVQLTSTAGPEVHNCPLAISDHALHFGLRPRYEPIYSQPEDFRKIRVLTIVPASEREMLATVRMMASERALGKASWNAELEMKPNKWVCEE
jgi:hypothetical protein